ncbi:MAG: hydrolase [Flaviaesturariibacter sp.]|nr:hydrolase [Flaviaesturariibacter sp.]
MPVINVRVYGVLIDEERGVLVSDELIRGGRYTKFPGGGLEVGEGTRDCLKREFLEEMDLAVEVGAHLYTTDYYQPSAFHADHQILSIYYYVTPLEPINTRISTEPFDFDEEQMERYRQHGETESFRFVPWEQLTEDTVNLPIEKRVVQRLLQDVSPLRG